MRNIVKKNLYSFHEKKTAAFNCPWDLSPSNRTHLCNIFVAPSNENRLFIPFCARFVYKFSQGRARAHSLKLDNFRSDSIQSKLGKTSFSY